MSYSRFDRYDDDDGDASPPVDAYGNTFGEWGSAICDCLDRPDILIDTVCFPCCQIALQCSAAEVDMPETMHLPGCCLMFWFPVTQWFFGPYVRLRVVQRYGIDEPWYMSVLFGVGCFWCSLVQTNVELNRRGVNPGGVCSMPDTFDDERRARRTADSQTSYEDYSMKHRGRSKPGSPTEDEDESREFTPGVGQSRPPPPRNPRYFAQPPPPGQAPAFHLPMGRGAADAQDERRGYRQPSYGATL